MKRTVWIFIVTLHLVHCIGFFDLQKDKNEFSKDALLLLLGSSNSGVPAGGGTGTPSGTRIQSSDELFTILIPEGAMDESVDFKITKYNSTQAPLPSGYVPTSSIYQVTPSYQFKKEVVISITLDRAKAQSMNLSFGKSKGFHVSTISTEPDAMRMPGWAGVNTALDSEKIVFQTKSFSMFGGGTPPPGNLPPIINGAFYYLKPGTRHVPFQVRADVVEPDGDVMNVYLVVGPSGGPTNFFSMTREGTTNWYRSNIPYEAMNPSGILMQIVAVDIHGQKATRPSTGTFLYPTDSNNPTYISQYNPDRDGDGYNDVWELDNGFNPNNASSPPGGTPNPPSLPAVVDTVEILPSQAWVQINEPITFSARGLQAGVQKFITANFHTTGIGLGGSPIGNLSSSTFTATTPGVAGVFATYQGFEAAASVHVADTIAPSNITDLVATALSTSRIQLRWTAPGSVGALGQASAYEIRRSTSPITNNLQCDAATGIPHTMVPKNSGLVEIKEIDGHLAQTTYYFCVRAIDSASNRNSWSGVVSATTYAPTDLVPPADVTTASATVESYHQIRLNWTAVGDNGNVGTASAYEIRRRSTPINSDDDCSASVFVPNTVVPAPAGSPLQFLVSGLSSGTVHYFCIRAFDPSGNRSLWSGILQATTPFANQAPVILLASNLQATLTEGESVTLDASGSFDPDASFCGAQANLYEYNWRLLSKPPLSALANTDIQNRTTKIARVIPDVIGDYVFEFSFEDNAGSCAAGNRTAVSLVNVTLNFRVATPTFSPTAGNQTSNGNITISTSTSGATIYYTTNGIDPTTSSTQYTSALVNIWSLAGKTIKAIAVKPGLANSAVLTGVFRLPPIKTKQLNNDVGIEREYTANGDGTIFDNASGLIWQKCNRGQNNDNSCSGTATGINWAGALNYCSGLSLGGREWRLPSRSELNTLLDYSKITHPYIEIETFPGTQNQYWSSTTYASDTSAAWNLQFTNAQWSPNVKTNILHVRCVSGASKEDIGAFTDNSDGTVLDKATGLLWQKCYQGQNIPNCSGVASGNGFNLDNAKAYCIGLSLAGRNWRLPTVNELNSILDNTKASGLKIDIVYFPGTLLGYYWSSTELGQNSFNAVNVDFANGFVNIQNRSTRNYVRCVAGP